MHIRDITELKAVLQREHHQQLLEGRLRLHTSFETELPNKGGGVQLEIVRTRN